MTTKNWLALGVVSLAVSVGTLHAQDIGTLTGSVLDASGAAVANSPVSLRWNDLGNQMSWDGSKRPQRSPRKKTLTAKTDEAGRFSVQLFSGAWDIFAYHDGLVPACTTAVVKSGKTSTVELRLPGPVQRTLE